MLTACDISKEILINKLPELLVVEPLIVLAIPDPILPRLLLCLKLLQLVANCPGLECLGHFFINKLYVLRGLHVALRSLLQ